MPAVTLNPYIHCNGEAEESLEFYKGVFGGTVTLSRFSDFPDMPIADDLKNQIMHGVLDADELQLMVSDATPTGGSKSGDNISLSLSGDDETKLRGYFDGLSVGGNVIQALEAHPWGDIFGMVTDKYGIKWMVNISAKPQS